MLERLKTMTVAGYLTLVVLSVLAPCAGFALAFETDTVEPGMYAPVEEPTTQEPGVEEPDVEPVDIGEPKSALGKAIWSEFGEADFFAGPKAGHDPADVDPDSGRVQEPLRGDSVYILWSDKFTVDEAFSLDAGGERFWLSVVSSRVMDGYTAFQILLPEQEPEGDTSPDGVLQENVFTAATAEEALALAGATWMDNGMASGDLQYDLKTYGVKLANTTASTVTIRFDGGEYVLETQGDQGIYFIW